MDHENRSSVVNDEDDLKELSIVGGSTGSTPCFPTCSSFHWCHRNSTTN